ncbi:MAG TPA: cytochrome d ubiquinol oxidase subunit II, partial [Bacteroidales bacterium]|nr:cytochrome d ubiquinol oxidase subunit II [Bacteroidales bacterium]
MTLQISYLFLREYWWLIISLLGGLLVFLMFVQGGQSFIFSLPRNDIQRKMVTYSLGRKWGFTFTTLVTFGGAFFASFPLFYATSFGGAYWLWMAILFSFVIQAVAYEYRSMPANVYGTRLFDTFLFINGCLGPFLIGVTVGTFFTGSDFTLDLFNRLHW